VTNGARWLSSDQTGTADQPLDPKLAPLASYGGPFPVMPPLPGSPVIAAGDAALVTNPPFPGPPFTDEEGHPRLGQSPSGSPTVEIGAVQFRDIPLVVTTIADSGDTPNAMTLRSAITLTNLIPGDHTITFNLPTTDAGYDPSSGSFTVHLTGGTLEISNRSGTTTMQGPGAGALTIDGGGASSVLAVDSNVSAAVSGLTITGGANGIANQGTLSVSQAFITNNTAAGILNSGTLTIADSTVSGNSGGGVSSSGTLLASRCTIRNNGGQGGVASTGTLTVTGCTFSANASDRYGGGVSTAASATITNCTFAANNADLGGGGVSVSAGSTTLTNCTIGSNLVNGSGGGIEVLGGNLSLYNTIVAGNNDVFPAADDIDGTLDARLPPGQRPSSYNLIGAGGSGGLANGTNGNIVGVADPKLGTLADNGGPTQTIALLPGSPAIDHGSNDLANAAALTVDQRRFGRIYNRTVDIGAYELGSALPGDLNHDGSVGFADLLSLAQHYGAANAAWEQGDLNGDGSVGFDDLLILAQDYGQGTHVTAVRRVRSSSALRQR
jgi:hypothetical protein